jgi:hypothetical protein
MGAQILCSRAQAVEGHGLLLSCQRWEPALRSHSAPAALLFLSLPSPSPHQHVTLWKGRAWKDLSSLYTQNERTTLRLGHIQRGPRPTAALGKHH